MSIRPVDYSTMVPKTQEISKVRQTEYNKIKTQLQQNFIQQSNKIQRNQKRIRDTNKSEHSKINVEDRKKSRYRQNNEERDKKEDKEKARKEQEKAKNYRVGVNIDIRV